MENPDEEKAGCCSGCLNSVGDDDSVLALGQWWHKDCFRCSACDAALSSSFVEQGGLPLCQFDCRALSPCADEDGCRVPSSLGEKVREAARRAFTTALSICIQLACFSIDTACNLLAMRAGDRVLSIDESSAQDRGVEAQRMVAEQDAKLTVGKDSAASSQLMMEAAESKEASEETPQDESGRRERLFKRKPGEGGTRARQVRRRRAAALDKERSCSLSHLGDNAEPGGLGVSTEGGVRRGLSRDRSFRAEPAPPPQVYRAADLLLGELLGAGFFGSVYKVTHATTKEELVLKQLHRLDEDAQKSFLKEVAVLRSLEHPNVLRFAGVLYKDKRLHLVTEYVAGGTLHDLIQDLETDLDWSTRAGLARDVAAGLRYLHAMSVIHRDLNSHNCLVRQDGTVVVADFGLARVVQRTTGSLARNTLRRKRYTVVGNPYWMAPEMLRGARYDERVDVFSFGILLCQIIGRVSADPDYLPRRSDFGLNEQQFYEKFCRPSCCPAPLSALAARCCRLEPDQRPPFDKIEPWLRTLAGPATPSPSHTPSHFVPQYLSPSPTTEPPGLLDAIQSYGETEPEVPGVVKCPSAPLVPRALGKCVSAGQLAPRRIPLTALSRSQQTLTTGSPGFIVRGNGRDINITRVHDVAPWLDAPKLKRASGDDQLHRTQDKSRKLDCGNLPAFLRNQSVEGLETRNREVFRQISEPGHEETDSSDDEIEICDWYRNVTKFNKLTPKEDIVPPAKEEKKSPEKIVTKEKTNFFTKRLMSPKLSRLFKSEKEDEDKSKSKFFVQHPSSPNFRYRVRPSEMKNESSNVIKTDLKLAGMGKPMTPIFRRHVPNEFSGEGRFSYRKPKVEMKFVELGRSKIKSSDRNFSPLVRSSQITNIAALTTVLEKDGVKSKTEKDSKGGDGRFEREGKMGTPRGISRSNYVSLASLKINGKTDLQKKGKVAAERAI